jgi:hypothetical protein
LHITLISFPLCFSDDIIKTARLGNAALFVRNPLGEVFYPLIDVS